MRLGKMRARLGQAGEAAGRVRLCDYQAIDRLPSQQRQMVNQYYQEIEIVRMVDHLIGALYFLHHFQLPHGAVRLEAVLLDDEGKYVLVDKELYPHPSNYELAVRFLAEQQDNNKQKAADNGIEFLAP